MPPLCVPATRAAFLATAFLRLPVAVVVIALGLADLCFVVACYFYYSVALTYE